MDLGEAFLKFLGVYHTQRTADAVERSLTTQDQILAVLRASEAQTTAVNDLTKVMAIIAGITLLCGIVQVGIAIAQYLKP